MQNFNETMKFINDELSLEKGIQFNEYQSSAIKELQRVPGKHGGLIIVFQNGSKWIYFDVPATTAVEMYNSESLGKAYHHLIKGNYRSQKLTA